MCVFLAHCVHVCLTLLPYLILNSLRFGRIGVIRTVWNGQCTASSSSTTKASSRLPRYDKAPTNLPKLPVVLVPDAHVAVYNRHQATGKLAFSYLAPLGLLSNREYSSLLQNAPKERLEASSLLFSSRDNESSRGDVGLVIALQGRLDIHMWSESKPPREARTVEAERKRETRFPPLSKEKPSPASDPAAPVIASIRRGQSFGDQTIALGHCSFWSSSFGASPPPSRVGVTFRVLVGEPGTEVMWISRALYENHLRDDRLRFEYVPFALLESSSAISSRVGTKVWEDMAESTGVKASSAVGPKRDARQVGRLGRSLMADASLSNLFFQFPPLVIERLSACLSLRQFAAGGKARVIQPGDSIQFVLIVIRGHLEIHRPEKTAATATTSSRFSKIGGSSGSPPSDAALDWYQRDRLIPGDAFGASELLHGHTSALHAVDAVADTLLLRIPQLVFRRWVTPSDSELIFTPGTVLAKLATASSPTKLARSEFRKLSATIVRRSSCKFPSPGRPAGSQVLSALPALPDEVTALLCRLGVLDTLPRFLASQLLPFAVLVRKRAGETLFQEADEKQVLVAVMSGFVSIYSREHMASAVEMLQNHPFCRVAAFSGSHKNPDEYVSLEDDDVAESSSVPCDAPAQYSPSKHHHRSATHGLHIQTLAPLSAFRTGVLHDGRVCPGTVVAQTDCECLIFDEDVYSHFLAHHSPAIDLSGASTRGNVPMDANGDEGAREGTTINVPLPGQTGTSSISKCLEESAAPWLRLSVPKKQLVICSMRQLVLSSGQQLISAGDRVNELVVVVAGNLSVFVRQSQELALMLDARQRSMKSLTLERSVTSNYSTTSQQLYSDDDDESGTSGLITRPRGLRKGDSFAIRRQLSRITRETQPSASGIFVDSVLAVVEEEKFRRQSAKLSGPPMPSSDGQRGVELVAPLLHSAIHRASIGRKLSIQRNGRRHSRFADHQGRHHRALFLCHLGPGDTFGEDVFSPSGSCQRSKHDVFADSSSSATGGGHTSAPGRVELLCLDRRVYQSILAKTDEEADCELRLRSAFVRSKWKRAGKDVTSDKRFQAGDAVVTERESSRPAQTATPKLLTLFQNFVNQRYHLTSRAIADIPLLRGLPEAAKREICLVAKFETLDRRSDINALYRLDAGGRGSSSKQSESPFFIVLSGRVALVGRNTHAHSVASGAVAVLGGSGGADSSQWLREVAAGDGFGEFGIFVPRAMPSVHPVAVEPSKMLSIPAPMFVKHWPLALQMKENIEYLRSGVSMFTDLALDRLACLYQVVEFRSFTRRESTCAMHAFDYVR